MAIPASDIVVINPGVVSAGGNPLDMNGLILTDSNKPPLGQIFPFSNAADVSAYFGPSSLEYDLAKVYFKGNDNKTHLPTTLYFAQFPTDTISAYLLGGSMAGVSLETLKTFSGTLTITIDGTETTSDIIDLVDATSFSNAAVRIQQGWAEGGLTLGTVTYDSISQAFKITSNTTGSSSTITYCSTSAFATNLRFTQARGATISQGSNAATPGTFMDSVILQILNWVGFTTTWEPDLGGKQEFAAWVNDQNHRFFYVAWDTDANALNPNDTLSLGPILKASESADTVLISGDADVATAAGSSLEELARKHAVFILGATASINFSATNGRITYAYKHQSGLVPAVDNQTKANILRANGYNFYGNWATSNDNFIGISPGSVSGSYSYLDELVNAIWIKNSFELAVMNLLFAVTSIPYNQAGYTMIEITCQDTINKALNFGAIRTGVPMSESQKILVNTAAGVEIDKISESRGWYLQIVPATAEIRGQRGSPPINFWYMDGGAIQKIEMASIVIQ